MDTLDIKDEELDAILSGADVDPEAPYGRFRNGKPRKSPPGKYRETDAAAPRKSPIKSESSKPKKGQPDYEGLFKNILVLPVTITTMAGQGLAMSGRDELGLAVSADAMTIALYQDELAKSVGKLAESNTNIANFLEKYGKGGVYGEVIGLGLVIGLQMAVNHGRMAPVPAMGLHDRDAIMKAAAEKVGGSDGATG